MQYTSSADRISDSRVAAVQGRKTNSTSGVSIQSSGTSENTAVCVVISEVVRKGRAGVYTEPRGVVFLVVEVGLIGTGSHTLVVVAIESSRAVEDTGVVDSLGKVLVVAPLGTVPCDVVGKEPDLALINA